MQHRALAQQFKQTATTMLGVGLRHTRQTHQRCTPELWFVCRKNQHASVCQR